MRSPLIDLYAIVSAVKGQRGVAPESKKTGSLKSRSAWIWRDWNSLAGFAALRAEGSCGRSKLGAKPSTNPVINIPNPIWSLFISMRRILPPCRELEQVFEGELHNARSGGRSPDSSERARVHHCIRIAELSVVKGVE